MTGFFSGIATAMITPFNKNGVNLDEFGKMIEYQIDGGTDALVVLGTKKLYLYTSSKFSSKKYFLIRPYFPI